MPGTLSPVFLIFHQDGAKHTDNGGSEGANADFFVAKLLARLAADMKNA
jgi:hypothetical protein